MGSERTKVTDPAVRLTLAMAFLRKEKRAIVTVLLTVTLGVSVWLRLSGPPGQIWSQREMRDLSGLPLTPAGAAVPIDDVRQSDKDAFLDLQQQLREQGNDEP